MAGWIGVDLDGTLAHFDRWRGPRHIGLPIPAMAKRVHDWHARGVEVRIFTARASRPELIPDVQNWLKRHGFPPLAVTNEKDFGMRELWDDRAVQVLYNTGKAVRPSHLESVERAEVFDPDEDVVYADTGARDTAMAVPSQEDVDTFKRNISASTDTGAHSLDDLMSALDDGDYAPGEAQQNLDNIDATSVDPIELPEIDLDATQAGHFPSAPPILHESAQPKNAIIEVDLDLGATITADTTPQQESPALDDESVDDIEFDSLPTTALTQAAPAEDPQEDADATLDNQPVQHNVSLDELDNHIDSNTDVDDLPDNLRSRLPSVNRKPAATSFPGLTALPEDELPDFDDLPAFRVERR